MKTLASSCIIAFLSNLSNKCKPYDPSYTKLLTMSVDGISSGVAGGEEGAVVQPHKAPEFKE